MVGEVRSLAFVVELIDKATKPLQDILGIGDKLDNAKIALGIELEDGGVAGKIDKVKGGMAKLSSVGDKMGESLSNAGDKMAGAGQKLQQVWDPASQSFYQAAVALDQVNPKLEEAANKMGPLAQKAQGVVDAFGAIKYQLLAVQTAAAAFMYTSIGNAAGLERLVNITKGTFGERADEVLEWAEAGSKLLGVTHESRLEMAQLFNTAKMGNEQIMSTTELVEKYWKNKALRSKLQVAGIGSKEDLAKQIKNVEIGGGRAFGLKQVWGKEALDDVIQNGHGAKKVLSLMRKDLEKTADTTQDTQNAQSNFQEAWGEFTEKAGLTLLPVVTKVYEVLTDLIMFLEQIPGVPAFAIISAAVVFLTISLGFLLLLLSQSYLGFVKLGVQLGITSGASLTAAASTALHSLATGISTAATYAWTAAQWVAAGAAGLLTGAVNLLIGGLTALKAAMLSNPITAAFVILLAVLILLETKFHVFSNLYKSLEKVDWGGKWSDTISWLTGLWDGLIEKVSWVQGLMSGLMGGGASLLSKLGGGNLAVGGLMVAIPGIGIMVVLLKALVGGFKGLLEMTGGGTQFLKDIYNELKKKFDAVLNFLGGIIPGWLKGLFDAVGGFFSWLQEGWTYLIDGLNRILASLNLPQIERPSTAAEKKSEAEKKAALDKELAANATAYNVDQAMGSERGIPAIGAGALPTYPSSFGGDFNDINFRSKSHPDVTRTGKELTTEQLLTGDWLPENFVSTLKDLTEVEKQLVNAKIDAVKNPPKVDVKVDKVVVTPVQQAARDKLAARPEPKAGEERTDEQYTQDRQDAIDAGMVEPGSEAIKGSDIKGSNWQWASPASDSSSSASTPSVSTPPASLPDATGMLGGGDKSSSSSNNEDQAPASTPSAPSAPAATGGDEPYDDSNYAGPGAGAEGGRITRTGRGLIHKKEEIISEAQGMMYNTGEIPTILLGIDKIKERLIGGSGAAPSQSSVSDAIAPQGKIVEKTVNLNFYAPIFTVASVANGFDVAKMQSDLVKFLRSEIKSAMKG